MPDYGVIRVSVNPSMVAMQVVDPNNPSNVDEYDYRRGKAAVDAPIPVDLTGSEPGALEQNTIPRADLNPTVIARSIQEAPGQSGIEQATASGATISYPLVAVEGTPPRIQVEVTGPRGHANPRYSLQGEKLEQ
ncbi:hypothetical protein A5631_02480 [Mycolicibacter heraklionensis]|nr:hypothetical protein A5631_02480 [Mycolicibacter heraklionensis]